MRGRRAVHRSLNSSLAIRPGKAQTESITGQQHRRSVAERGYVALPPAKERRELWALPDQFPVIAIQKLSWQSTLHLTVLGTSSKRASSLRGLRATVSCTQNSVSGWQFLPRTA